MNSKNEEIKILRRNLKDSYRFYDRREKSVPTADFFYLIMRKVRLMRSAMGLAVLDI